MKAQYTKHWIKNSFGNQDNIILPRCTAEFDAFNYSPDRDGILVARDEIPGECPNKSKVPEGRHLAIS